MNRIGKFVLFDFTKFIVVLDIYLVSIFIICKTPQSAKQKIFGSNRVVHMISQCIRHFKVLSIWNNIISLIQRQSITSTIIGYLNDRNTFWNIPDRLLLFLRSVSFSPSLRQFSLEKFPMF